MAAVQAGKVVGVRQDIGAPGDSRIDIASPEIVAGALDSGEARRAGRINAKTGARESEEVTIKTTEVRKGQK
jgi:hypothetical protein